MISLEEEFRQARGLALTQLVERDILDLWPRYEKVREHRSLYFGTATAAMPLPWEDASAIHLPLLMEKTDTLVPLLMSAFWGVDPVVNVERSPEEYMEEQTDDIQQFMSFVVEKDVPNLYETFETWLRDMGLDGMSTVSPYWVKSFRRVSEIHNLKAVYEQGDTDLLGEEIPDARNKSAMELLTELFGMPGGLNGIIDAVPLSEYYADDEVIGTQWFVRFVHNRQPFEAEVQFIVGNYVDEVRARVRRMIVDEDCAHVDILEYEDIILPYRSKDVQTADRVTQKYWLTVDEIQELRQLGEWQLTDAEMATIKGSGTYQQEELHLDTGIQRQKDEITGESSNYGVEQRIEMPAGFLPYDRNKVLCFAVYLRDDVDGLGIRQEVIYHIPYALRKIVKADYLDEVFPHGKRPFIMAKYLPTTNRVYALGMGDQLAAINLECNAIINFVNNNQELINNPYYFYEPTAFNADVKSLRSIRPGQGIPVMSTQGILFPQFQQTPLSNMEMLTSLLMFADRLTISPMNAGSSQMKNAPRTARGTLALLGEGHVKVDMLITRLQRGPWVELMEQLFGLYQSFCPDEKWYWITRNSETRPERMTREMLRGRYEFKFTGNTVNTNREVLRSLAQVRYNTVMTHPDYATDPKVRKSALRDFLKFFGDGTDIDRLIPADPGEGAYTHGPMRQQDENKVLELGAWVLPLSSDDHAAHLQAMEQFEATAAFGRMPEAYIGLWAAHRQQHMEMLRAQVMQAQLPVTAGAGNNVPQGETQGNAGTGTSSANVMGGGNMR